MRKFLIPILVLAAGIFASPAAAHRPVSERTAEAHFQQYMNDTCGAGLVWKCTGVVGPAVCYEWGNSQGGHWWRCVGSMQRFGVNPLPTYQTCWYDGEVNGHNGNVYRWRSFPIKYRCA